MGLPTTLIGYSPNQGKVVQYRVEIEVTGFKSNIEGKKTGPARPLGKPGVATQVWTDYLFAEKTYSAGPLEVRH